MAAARPAAVGAFVLGGLALAVAAVLIFGGTRLFKSDFHAVVFFPGSVSGLAVGAPVTFRGVRIGHVAGIKLHVNVPDLASVIPVDLDIDADRISWTNGPEPSSLATDLERAVQAGLRAQLSTDSLVTGQLSVNLDFRTDTKAVFLGSAGGVLEIPAIGTDLQQIKDEVASMHLPEVADQTRQVLASLQRVLLELEGRIGPLADSLQQTVGAARTTLETATTAVREVQVSASRTLDDVDLLAVRSRQQIATSGEALDHVLAKTGDAVTQANKLLASVNEMTAPRSPMRGDLEATLRDLAASAGSLRTLTRELQRDPSATLLKGVGK